MDPILTNLMILRSALRKAEREVFALIPKGGADEDDLLATINVASTAATSLYTLLVMGAAEHDPVDAEA